MWNNFFLKLKICLGNSNQRCLRSAPIFSNPYEITNKSLQNYKIYFLIHPNSGRRPLHMHITWRAITKTKDFTSYFPFQKLNQKMLKICLWSCISQSTQTICCLTLKAKKIQTKKFGILCIKISLKCFTQNALLFLLILCLCENMYVCLYKYSFRLLLLHCAIRSYIRI